MPSATWMWYPTSAGLLAAASSMVSSEMVNWACIPIIPAIMSVSSARACLIQDAFSITAALALSMPSLSEIS